jgi:hypothetical protein
MAHRTRHTVPGVPFKSIPVAALLAGLLITSLAACGKTPGSGSGEVAGLEGVLETSLDRAVLQYAAMDEALPDTLFPRTTGPGGTLLTNRSGWWTSGFFPGSLWLLYEYTGDPEVRARALARTWAVEREKLNAGDHDIGFKIFTSFGQAWRLTGDTALVPVLLTAARTLTTRFDPRVGAIRSWGAHPDTTAPYLVIIDNMMNLELLFWAARESGDASFFDIAVSHADKTLEHHFRPDGSSYHVLEYDPITGEVLRKRTQQGFSDGSAWARGQAWGLYGFTVAYRETGYGRYLEQARAIAHFILEHPKLPIDGVPCWDFDAPDIPDTYRDSSAGAIMASALLRLAGFVEDSLRAVYQDHAATILRSLSGPPYRTELGGDSHFILRHGVGSLPQESEVDVPLSYGDYYYLEASLRLRALLDGSTPSVRLVPLGTGWARSSVNAAIFRQHGLLSRDSTQYATYYDPDGRMVLARRTLGDAHWDLHPTRYFGDVRDAHNAISIGLDGSEVLHVSWDQHGEALRYARSLTGGGLVLSDPLPMTGLDEEEVTYPQFYELPGGDLLFLYRDGASGDGDVMLNRYSVTDGNWRPLHHPLIDGEGRRNAYVNQLAMDEAGGWHLSWTWRESWDVASNHDILYACSRDEGESWQRSTGEPYDLPITESNAEVAVAVPQGRGLINQTTTAVDDLQRPLIATYWEPDGAVTPQYHLVWNNGSGWRANSVGHRTGVFDLAGGGTRRIPLSRPLVLAGPGGAVYVVFRDLRRGGGISLAVSTEPTRDEWRISELYAPAVGFWEPVWDPGVWVRYGRLHLLVQRVGQGEAEGLETIPPQPVWILEWEPDLAPKG